MAASFSTVRAGGWIRPAPDTAGCTWPLRHWRAGGQIITNFFLKKQSRVLTWHTVRWVNGAATPSKTKKGTADITLIFKEKLKHIITMEEATASCPKGETSPGRLRSYLHKQLDNWLVVWFYSVLRYRQRHSGCCYQSFIKKSVLPRPTSLGSVVHVFASAEPNRRSCSPVEDGLSTAPGFT